MNARAHRARVAWLLALAPALLAARPMADAIGAPAGEETCEGCHRERPEARVEFPDGSSLSAFVDLETAAGSVHGRAIGCTDCHRQMAGYPHEPLPQPSARAYQQAQARTCNRCHYAHFTRTLDGIHYAEHARGNQDAPTCVDCHGAHEVQVASAPRTAMSERCGGCHEDQARVYADSVHGRSLAEGSPDAPVCTDCHGAHGIADPKQPAFRAGSYEICARCHGDGARMARYDLSKDVLTTYMDDFHGRSNHLYIKVGHIPERPIATCGDCHGVHDVQRLRDEGGVATVQARVTDMCRKCHEDATDGFAGAWLSHSAPTRAGTPLVWGVTWGYRILIPFMLLGLVLHILLHLWRLPAHHPAEE